MGKRVKLSINKSFFCIYLERYFDLVNMHVSLEIFSSEVGEKNKPEKGKRAENLRKKVMI